MWSIIKSSTVHTHRLHVALVIFRVCCCHLFAGSINYTDSIARLYQVLHHTIIQSQQEEFIKLLSTLQELIVVDHIHLQSIIAAFTITLRSYFMLSSENNHQVCNFTNDMSLCYYSYSVI